MRIATRFISSRYLKRGSQSDVIDAIRDDITSTREGRAGFAAGVLGRFTPALSCAPGVFDLGVLLAATGVFAAICLACFAAGVLTAAAFAAGVLGRFVACTHSRDALRERVASEGAEP